MSKKVYEVISEGKVIYGFEDDTQISCGEVIINLVELDEEGDFVDTIEGFIDATIIEDKWGESLDPKPREIEGVFDEEDLELEFTNGVISLGYFDTLEEAQKVMNNQFEGSVNVMDLERE